MIGTIVSGQSIKSKESLFGTNAARADLDGDGAFGLSADALTSVSMILLEIYLKKMMVMPLYY